ncbi:MAG: hypothetical protein KY397_01095 [Gemmatimonadetes bacterium]|nr:hypothetical protein [Gemmatimonadota bacterium]
MGSRYDAADFSDVRPVPFASRGSKVSVTRFGEVLESPPAVERLVATLPDLLAAADFRAIVDAWATAVRRGRAVVLLCGGHVVKTGVSPYLIDAVHRGWIDHLAFSGATAIHDFEIACFGETSEDVTENLAHGTFGLADETGRWMAEAAIAGLDEDLGLGEALGRWLLQREPEPPHLEQSLLAQAYRREIPLTVHVTIGADVVHQHPAFDPAVTGTASHRDFRILAASLRGLADGGFVANVGSAVVLPEVFVKALNVARHLGSPVKEFTAADFDVLRHYRPTVNVIGRPVLEGGRGFHLTGHHELTVPLLYYALRALLGE